MGGVRNTLGDLHNSLMEQIERLSEAEGDELEVEIERSRVMSAVAAQINYNANTMIKAISIAADTGVRPARILTAGSGDEVDS